MQQQRLNARERLGAQQPFSVQDRDVWPRVWPEEGEAVLGVDSDPKGKRRPHVDAPARQGGRFFAPHDINGSILAAHSALLFVRHTNMSLCALIDARFLLCEDRGSDVESARKCCSRQAEALTRLGLLCSCPSMGLCPKHYTRVQSLCKRLVFPICHRSSTYRGHERAVWTVAPSKKFSTGVSAGGVND